MSSEKPDYSWAIIVASVMLGLAAVVIAALVTGHPEVAGWVVAGVAFIAFMVMA